jgi:hypothetical protein
MFEVISVYRLGLPGADTDLGGLHCNIDFGSLPKQDRLFRVWKYDTAYYAILIAMSDPPSDDYLLLQ